MTDDKRSALLSYLQRECRRVSWDARDSYEHFASSLRYSRNPSSIHACWNCEQGAIGLQLASSDWFKLIESVRDDHFEELDRDSQAVVWIGFYATAEGERFSIVELLRSLVVTNASVSFAADLIEKGWHLP